MVELATSRGEGTAVYKRGSFIRFLVRLNRDAYVYLFDFNSKGEAIRLYPEPRARVRPIVAGAPMVIPDDSFDYAFEVQPPFGKDEVLAVAAEQPLAIPDELAGDWAWADAVPNKLRALGEAVSGGYAEARLELVTGE